ncbi:hypothetical protein Pmani_006909 [Petrolisthes manimaculis]|uniref:Creatinase N-terminal domain-containing protein n=1 Tax=Petrolisthes manimaculis TaxID=1843537 RepID=A0AAE1UG40_9EUCA|nr:hypothetical protein Pmani_006909 [Petrolisthes manimaculis]
MPQVRSHLLVEMVTLVISTVLLLALQGCGGVVVKRRVVATDWHGINREVTLEERFNCSLGDIQPPNRVDTAERVARLRQEMANYGIDAYFVNTDDQHQNEYVSPPDERVKYISGFSGSAGMFVVSMTEQALWTDGRYFLQADSQMDCNWLLMKSGLEGVPSVLEWMKEVLPSGSRVGSDPAIITAQQWISSESSLAESGIVLVNEAINLVDIIWTDRPAYSSDPAFVLDLAFAGKSWEEKVDEVRTAQGTDILVVTELDAVAWILNLRGSDVPYNPGQSRVL